MAQQSKGSSGSTGSGTQTQAQVSNLRSVVADLKNALTSSGQQADQTIQDCITKISQRSREFNQFSQQPAGSDAKKLFDDTVKTLKQASDMGYDSAKKALKNIGASAATQSSYQADVEEEDIMEEGD